MRRLRVALLGTALILVALAAGPPLVSAITSALLVTSTMKDPVNVNNDGMKLKTKGSPRIVFTDPPPCASGNDEDEDNDENSEDEEDED